MPVSAAYVAVILIWSTTPLAIQWSGQSVGYEFGVAARMLIGLIALSLIVKLRNLPLPSDRHHLLVYMAGGLPLFLAMTSVYWAAQSIPSGWISVIFGLTPLLTSLFATWLLGENAFGIGKTLGMLLGLAGLCVVFTEGLAIAQQAWLGVLAVGFAATVHSLSSVLIKKLKPEIPAISITTGSLLVATPLYALNSLMHGLPEQIPAQTLTSILYLAIMGTALGFPLYFYCLRHLAAERVALITLITPVSALLLGAWLNGEVISLRIWLGTALILGGLAIYEYGKYLPWKDHWIRWKQNPW